MRVSGRYDWSGERGRRRFTEFFKNISQAMSVGTYIDRYLVERYKVRNRCEVTENSF